MTPNHVLASLVGITSKRIRGRMHDRWVGQSPLGRRERYCLSLRRRGERRVRGAIQLTREPAGTARRSLADPVAREQR